MFTEGGKVYPSTFVLFVELFDDADDGTTGAGSLESSILTTLYTTSDQTLFLSVSLMMFVTDTVVPDSRRPSSSLIM